MAESPRCVCEHHAIYHEDPERKLVEVGDGWALRLGPCSGCECPHFDPQPVRAVTMGTSEPLGAELAAALGRLRWVVPGRDYDPKLIADVETVLNHFGMTNAHEGRT